MNKTIILSALGITLLGSAAVLAQGQPAGPQKPMSFFITSTTEGSGNLGGLAGADATCQRLAAAAGAGGKTWHAYLSQSQQGNEPAVNAPGRIGPGPWYNAKGVLIASRDRNNVQKITALDEKGNSIKGIGDMPNQHDILTGSDSDGRAFPGGFDATCNNWTSNTDTNHAMLGHADRSGGGNVSWNSVHMSAGCSKEALVRTGGAGHLYCFAIN